ncbi:tyrosine-type recombinase/integrase [Arenimonas donghaensis]|uniref:Tyr recombinase domain-containing protein n=1 Tax=Arenimonas donghaensis DSM 18148 = HO3-R19 TaxID=1121014 RepID=A0A087MIL0_9GAMM|nr:hypothetical protein [Arenimonas donghaensis]KFL36713.1 hypothetical protein N788_03640 [Arenimonas donghaensis DSM 18148 = HO3-R19]
MGITVRGLESLKPGEWLTESGNRNVGALRAKGGPNGARFYFRYRDSAGRYDDLPLGAFDARGRDGLTLTEAKTRAGELSRRYLGGETDLRLALETERRETELALEAKARAHEAAKAKRAATLGALLTAYVAQLERDGKASAKAVARAVTRHVAEPWPSLWEKAAEEVTIEDLVAVLARVVDGGKLTEARKLRAYLSAAYQAAIRARQDARGLEALRKLRITRNPARDLATVDGGSKARDRALSVAELQAYWRRIRALPCRPAGALLRFHLLTGAQRVEQLSRLTKDDLDRDADAVCLRDAKGRRKVPRLHLVPLLPEAWDALQAMAPGRVGPFLFSVTAGETGAAYSSVLLRLREVVAAMEKAGELERGPFTVGDLRRTVETRLAAVGVSTETRAQLQSHGLGGVQARHYDRHDYLEDKRAALVTLLGLCEATPATVTPITGRKIPARRR